MKIFSKFTESIKHLVSKATMEQFHERYYIREFKIWEIDSTLAINLYLGIVTRLLFFYLGPRKDSSRKTSTAGSRIS